jgi:hypothetical protein
MTTPTQSANVCRLIVALIALLILISPVQIGYFSITQPNHVTTGGSDDFTNGKPRPPLASDHFTYHVL